MTLQDTETCLRRPFVFKQACYDFEYLSKELKKIKVKLVKECGKALESYPEMKLGVGEDGHVH